MVGIFKWASKKFIKKFVNVLREEDRGVILISDINSEGADINHT